MKKPTNKPICPWCGKAAKLKKDPRFAYCKDCEEDIAKCDFCGDWVSVEHIEVPVISPTGREEVIACTSEHHNCYEKKWLLISYAEKED